jgi:hypothetical protein
VGARTVEAFPWVVMSVVNAVGSPPLLKRMIELFDPEES